MWWRRVLVCLVVSGCVSGCKAAAESPPPSLFDGFGLESTRELELHLQQKMKGAKAPAFLEAQVAANVTDKRLMKFPMTEDELRRTVIDYEAFKLETFLSSGVFPKRYFGYVDEKWDTAPYEQEMKATTVKGVRLANEYLEETGSALRITDAEIVATLISEGGAILLREHQAYLDNIHPVFGVGLDNISTGFEDEAKLVIKLDAAFDTDLGDVVRKEYREGDRRWLQARGGGRHYLNRYLTFEEAVLATIVMYVWEKKIAQRKVAKQWGAKLETMPLDEQFIVGSLVYNSGKPHNAERTPMIRDFTSAQYLYDRTMANKATRPIIPVLPADEALKALLETGSYPEQPTSWIAVYHIQQRYGGYVGLMRFTDAFDAQGMYR